MIDRCDVEFDPARKVWTLTAEYTLGDYTIPAGFESDLASIPRFLWPVIGPHELGTTAPIVHDYLYRTRVIPIPREEADKFFLWIMEQDGVSTWRRTAAFLAVRLFGWRAWRKT